MGQAQEKTQVGNIKVVTGKCRASYVKIFRPEKDDNDRDVWSMTLLIPKTDTKTVNNIRAAIAAAKLKKWGDPDEDVSDTFRDGDAPKSQRGKGGKGEYAGHYFMGVKSFEPVGIVDTDRNDVLDSREFVSGDYCRVSIGASGYDRNGNSGVTFYLNNVQVLGKGEPLSGRSRAEDDFGDDFEGSDADDLF